MRTPEIGLDRKGVGGDVDPATQTFSYKAITFFIDEEKLARPGGLGSDILITVQLVTEVGAFVDPTGVADVVNAGALAAQGEYSEAAMAAAGIVVPFGADKLARAVRRAPVGIVDELADSIRTAVDKASKRLDNIADKSNDLAAAARANKARADDLAKASKGGTSVASGMTGEILRATIIRTIAKGEKVDDLIRELAQSTYESGGLEHAIISLQGGGRVIVRGETGGIQFGDDLKRVLLHTHPTTTGPSAADFRMLEQLGQRHSYIYELFGGGLTRFDR
jgi:hypothetical protein